MLQAQLCVPGERQNTGLLSITFPVKLSYFKTYFLHKHSLAELQHARVLFR